MAFFLKEFPNFRQPCANRFFDILNPIHSRLGWGRGGGGQKGSPNSFSTVTSTNVGISPPKFLTLSFYAFVTLV